MSFSVNSCSLSGNQISCLSSLEWDPKQLATLLLGVCQEKKCRNPLSVHLKGTVPSLAHMKQGHCIQFIVYDPCTFSKRQIY